MTELRVHFLGTSSAMPTRERGLSCTVIQYEDQLLFFDCGEGCQRSAAVGGLSFNKPTFVFVTHMHGDHVVGLLGLLQTMSMQNRDKPLYVFGPKGIVEFIQANQKMLRFGLTYPVFGKVVRAGVVLNSKKFKVVAKKSKHSTLSYAYVFQEKDKPGRFNTRSALKLGVPEGPLWSRLQDGKSVTSPKTKRKVLPNQILGPPRAGMKIGISGDTRPSRELSLFFRGCDLIVFDSTYGDDHVANAVENQHSTSREAAKLAKSAKAGQLILYHFSARYKSTDELLREAREVFPKTIAASDYMVYDVPSGSVVYPSA